jgi:pimeloyl-ACP methyl ester carboxylesterase
MPTLDRTAVTAPDGTQICRWGREPGNATEAVVFVHGATYGARSAFDPDGVSWLDAVAATGRAAYAPDVRGYGDSDSPPALDAPADRNSPVVRASTAARDVAAAIETVRERYETVHLVGYSWGTMISGLIVTEHGVDVTSLVQYAPVFQPEAARRNEFGTGDSPGAFREVTRTEARKRWADQRPEGAVPDDAFDAFWQVLSGSGQRVDADTIRAPNGTLLDLRAAVDAPLYDATGVDIPTLVVRGSLDTASSRADSLALFEALTGPDRTYTEIADGTHFLQFESGRQVLYETVRGFHERVGSR